MKLEDYCFDLRFEILIFFFTAEDTIGMTVP